MAERVQKAEKLLEEVLKRNPDLFIRDIRKLKEDMFYTIGRALVRLESVEELYMTSATRTDCPETSYRLWLGRPNVSRSDCYPDWTVNYEIAVAAMVKVRKIRTENTDRDICEKLAENSHTANLTPEVIRGHEGSWPDECRIYKIK